MDQPLSSPQFETLLPLAADWAAEQEALILREGVPLSDTEIIDAKAAGVKEPERVRLLQVNAIPSPEHPLLKAACQAINSPTSAPRGLTFHHGIFVRRDCAQDRHLVAHELVHTAQYERLGGIIPFLRKYLSECFTSGYHNAPLEQEAAEIAQRICSYCREELAGLVRYRHVVAGLELASIKTRSTSTRFEESVQTGSVVAASPARSAA